MSELWQVEVEGKSLDEVLDEILAKYGHNCLAVFLDKVNETRATLLDKIHETLSYAPSKRSHSDEFCPDELEALFLSLFVIEALGKRDAAFENSVIAAVFKAFDAGEITDPFAEWFLEMLERKVAARDHVSASPRFPQLSGTSEIRIHGRPRPRQRA